MKPFVKLYATLLTSTVWSEPHSTRIVWITLLTMADRDGYVAASIPGLAHSAHVSRAECEIALKTFLAPDADSRTKEHQGRRIEIVDGGWIVLNREKYADMRSTKQIDDAARQARHREKGE